MYTSKKGQSMVFARYGGLSPKKQNHYVKESEMEYHSAPEKRGFYSFLWPYIDWFLLGGTEKIREDYTLKKRDRLLYKYRKFKVNGYIWVHINIPKKYQHIIKETKGSWYKVHSKDFEEVFKKIFAYRVKEAMKFKKEFDKKPSLRKKADFKIYSYDDLEVFIPKKTKIL